MERTTSSRTAKERSHWKVTPGATRVVQPFDRAGGALAPVLVALVMALLPALVLVLVLVLVLAASPAPPPAAAAEAATVGAA